MSAESKEVPIGERMKRFMCSMAPPNAHEQEEIPLTGAMMCSIMVLNSVIERTGNRLLEEHNLTLPQWLALGVISHCGEEGATHGAIGQRLMLSKAPITGVVDRLERAGLVERRPDAHDRRVSRVVATPAGIQTWWDVRAPMRAHSLQTVNATLSREEQEQLLHLLGRLLDAYAAQDPSMQEFGAEL